MNNLALQRLNDVDMVIDESLNENNAVSRVYAYTNESLRAYIDLLNLKDGRVATVGSSGDQAFYAIYKNAKEVTVIDANPLSKPCIEWKKTAIENMSKQEFIRYWTPELILNPGIVEGLRDKVRSGDTKLFLDVLLDKVQKDGENKVKYQVFHDHSFFVPFNKDLISLSSASEMYDNDENYSRFQEILKNTEINYSVASLSDFPQELSGEYETIMLSNIYDYLPRRHFFPVVKELIKTRLKDGGTMQTHYEFGYGREYASDEEMFLRDGIRSDAYIVKKTPSDDLFISDQLRYKSNSNHMLEYDEDLVYICKK